MLQVLIAERLYHVSRVNSRVAVSMLHVLTIEGLYHVTRVNKREAASCYTC
jgi:hypothetical protein